MERALTGVAAAERVEGAASPLLLLLSKTVRALTESREQRKLRSIVDEASSSFAEVLARAEDKGDLGYKLQLLVTTPHLGRIERATRRLPEEQLDQALEDASSDTGFADSLKVAFGAAVSRHLLRALQLSIACMEAERSGDLSALEKYFPPSGKPHRDEHAFPLTDDPDIPVELAESLLQALKGDVGFVALFDLLKGRKRLQPWMALALAEAFENGQYERLRFWALVPGSNVADALVAPGDRWNLEELSERHRRRTERARSVAEEARRSRRPLGRLPTD